MFHRSLCQVYFHHLHSSYDITAKCNGKPLIQCLLYSPWNTVACHISQFSFGFVGDDYEIRVPFDNKLISRNVSLFHSVYHC